MASEEGANARPPACIHVDLDSVWAYGATFGLDIHETPDPILHSSVDNFLDIFEKHGVKATFFLTGKDAADRGNGRIIEKLMKAGHEIANHSMSHRPNFTRLGRREMEEDIKESTRAIEDATGQKCRGFRTPTYNIDGTVLGLLQEHGYAYDSSILPTFISPALKLASAISYRKSIDHGMVRHVLAPLEPYHPDKKRVWRRGSMDIVEVPISTMPLLRLPFHCSLVFQTGLPLFRLGIRLARLAGTPLVYLFHARELAEQGGDWSSRLPFRELPLARRKELYEAILTAIRENFRVITTEKLIEIVH